MKNLEHYDFAIETTFLDPEGNFQKRVEMERKYDSLMEIDSNSTGTAFLKVEAFEDGYIVSYALENTSESTEEEYLDVMKADVEKALSKGLKLQKNTTDVLRLKV